jgi:hypothetical protein
MTSTFEDGLGTGPKSGQKLRRRRSEPGLVVPTVCLSCALRCNCTRQVPRGARFLECYQAPKEATR